MRFVNNDIKKTSKQNIKIRIKKEKMVISSEVYAVPSLGFWNVTNN